MKKPILLFPESLPVRARYAFLAALALTLLMATSLSMGIAASLRAGLSPLTINNGVSAMLMSVGMAGTWLSRRGRHETAAMLLAVGLAASGFMTVILLSGAGLAIGLFMAAAILAIAGFILSGSRITPMMLFGVISGAAIILTDLFWPLPREANSNFRIAVPYITAGIIAVALAVVIGQFRSYSLRAKLLIASLFTTTLSVAFLGTFMFYRARQTQASMTDTLQTTVQEQVRQQLLYTAQTEARNAGQALSAVAESVEALADYRTALYSQASLFGEGAYWDANTRLFQMAGGQYGNAASDLASVFIPNTVTLDEALFTDLNTSAHLDFNVLSTMKTRPDIVAVYFINTLGATTYYPNIGLASAVPPDFDPSTQPFYTIASPENNPERSVKWTIPYQDPAGTGLIVTSSMPVYDPQGEFRGVLGADVQLSKIAEQISGIRVGESGFAFLVDSQGRIIAMPEAGYPLFGLQPEVIPVNESPKETVLNKGPADLQDITRGMTAGLEGLETAVIQGTPYYLAYTSLPAIDYSLGVMVPTAELDAPYLAARDRTEAETAATVRLSSIIVMIALAAAGVVGALLSQVISRPLVHLTQAADRITRGDLNVTARVESEDETGTLARAFNAMTDQLRGLIGSLEQRVAERTKALTTSTEVSRRLSTILEQGQLVTEVVEQVKAAFGYYHAHIYLFDEERGNLVMAGGTGDAGQAMLAKGHRIPRGRGLVGRAAETNTAVIVPDVRQDPSWLPNPLLPDTKSEIAVPIAAAGRVIGVLDVQHDVPDGLKQEDADLLMSLASQVAIALQNARAYSEARRRADREALIASIGRKIQGTANLEAALQVTARELGRALNSRDVQVVLEAPGRDGNGDGPDGGRREVP